MRKFLLGAGAMFGLLIVIGLMAAPKETPAAQVVATPAPSHTAVATPEPVEPEPSVDPAPKYTVAQENAIKSAESYLDYSGFSRKGLIDQLKYEGFSVADATFAVDTIDPDWNAEAVESAKAYLDYSSFSRKSLIDQLVYEGFTKAQATYGTTKAGL